MADSTQVVLQKTLNHLLAQKAKIEREVKVVQSALSAIGVTSPHLSGRRKRKPMSSAERKSVSKRMKAYWAKRGAKKS